MEFDVTAWLGYLGVALGVLYVASWVVSLAWHKGKRQHLRELLKESVNKEMNDNGNS